jgi:hypothetical protein
VACARDDLGGAEVPPRLLHTRTGKEAVVMANVVLVLCPDPVSGYPPVYGRDSFPVLHGIDEMLFLNLG